MKYMGSKSRFAKEIKEITLVDRMPEQYYVEPFCGGCNMIDSVAGLRIANDVHPYLIAMWRQLMAGWIPGKVSKELYQHVKNNKEKYPDYLVGWIGFNCSYSGKYFGGFAGETRTKQNTIRDYQQEAINNLLKQVQKLKGVDFRNDQYDKLVIPNNSIVYCDPPYANTTGYLLGFDHVKFWDWIRQLCQHNRVFVSEYSAPDDFKCIWEKTAKSSLSANGKIGGNKESVERLFVYA